MIYFDRKNLLSESGKFNLQTLEDKDGVAFFQAKTEAMDISVKEVILQDYRMCEVWLNVKKPTIITTAYHPGIVITIPLTKQLIYSIEGFGKGTLLKSHFNMLYTPASAGRYHFETKGEYKFISILFDFSYLNKWKETHLFLARFLADVEAMRLTTLSNVQLTATGQMIFLVDELFLPDRAFPEMHRHATILAFLRLAIFQSTSQRILHSQTDLYYERDSLKIKEIREYLTLHLETNYTLEELESKFNIRERKLRDDFRKEYGLTVFEFVLQERMKVARQLLLETSLSFSDIGQRLGYAYLPNFSQAFKLYYKVSPREFRGKFVEAERMVQAKQRLLDSDLTVREIAKELGFEPNNFSNSFKRYFKLTPLEFRKGSLN